MDFGSAGCGSEPGYHARGVDAPPPRRSGRAVARCEQQNTRDLLASACDDVPALLCHLMAHVRAFVRRACSLIAAGPRLLPGRRRPPPRRRAPRRLRGHARAQGGVQQLRGLHRGAGDSLRRAGSGRAGSGQRLGAAGRPEPAVAL